MEEVAAAATSPKQGDHIEEADLSSPRFTDSSTLLNRLLELQRQRDEGVWDEVYLNRYIKYIFI